MSFGDFFKGFWGNNAVNGKGAGAPPQTGYDNFPGGHENLNNRRNRRNAMAERLNNLDAAIYRQFLYSLFIGRFEWRVNGEIMVTPPQHTIEKNILYNGNCFAFRDPEIGILFLPANIVKRDIYNEPSTVMVQGVGYSREVNYTDGVMIYDNPLYFAPVGALDRAAELLADLNRTCEVYSSAMKRPVIMFADKKISDSVKAMAADIMTNEFVQVIDYEMKDTLSGAVPQNMPNPNNAGDLRGLFSYKQALLSDYLSQYGISASSAQQKMANITEDEINASGTATSAVLQRALTYRKRFAEQMTGLLGEKFTVELQVLDPVKVSVDAIEAENREDEDVEKEAEQ